ncbi:hypothetical protein A7A08_02450 [Methyloligella halotolerans]|uniref:Uncharacterized protein n=1 Tax=Methyloligella halotolerans TaxID=1177755 RepID=A0A1E2RX04_9HYPH|nr:DUF6790 family protein [Methyloligella halotolerans]ODA66682.1 hypothetical protein A7A08_02450 [Methyloligella halotolerans]
MSYMIAAIPMLLYAAALILGLAGVPLGFADQSLSPLAQWMLVLSLGVQSLWAAFAHSAMRERVAESIGWEVSPFQLEIAGANLGIGLGAIAASMLGEPSGWAIFFVAAGFLWSAAATHLKDMFTEANFAINNAGPIFWWDLLTPLTLLIALW